MTGCAGGAGYLEATEGGRGGGLPRRHFLTLAIFPCACARPPSCANWRKRNGYCGLPPTATVVRRTTGPRRPWKAQAHSLFFTAPPALHRAHYPPNIQPIAGRATPALRCGRTIAGSLPQLFSFISDIVVNKSKNCCKSDFVARVKN